MKAPLTLVLLLACGPEVAAPEEHAEPIELPMENDGEPDPPLREEEEGAADDVPERGRLEARCFSGDQAACDELGH